MKRNYFLFAIFAVVFLLNRSVTAQWVQTNGPHSGINSDFTTCLAVNGTSIFAGTGGGVFRTSDNGSSWIAANAGLTDMGVWVLLSSNSNLFAGTLGQGVFLSTNNGENWSASNHGLIDTIFVLAVSGTNLFAGTKFSGVFRTSDNGTNWQAVNNGLTGIALWVSALAVSNTNLFAATSGGVFRSSDNGTNWIEVDSGLQYGALSLAVSGTNLFAGTGQGGVFLSNNNGASWREVNTGLTDTEVTAFAVSGINLFAGAENFIDGAYHGSVWRRPLSEMINGNAVEVLPSVDHSSKVFPNPFSQSTTISFSSSGRGFAQVTVVNLLGSEVARIFTGELEASEHSFTWDASRMTPGMYECVIRTGNHIVYVPMIVVH